jgi:hypothetical protein
VSVNERENMTTTADITEQILELDERENDGIRVTLVWNRATDRLTVLVSDERTSESFSLEVEPGEDPHDVFEHPFAYAAFRGHCTDGRAILGEPAGCV